MRPADYDLAGLRNALRKLEAEKKKWENARDVTIVIGDRVPYNEMIKTLDLCLVVGLDNPALQGSIE